MRTQNYEPERDNHTSIINMCMEERMRAFSSQSIRERIARELKRMRKSNKELQHRIMAGEANIEHYRRGKKETHDTPNT